jgi:IclR family mhp operon transcriptional activator
VTNGAASGAGTLLRGLELLRLLNEAHPLHVRELHEATGFPKPTISRLLSTLLEAGYVQRDPRLGYRPSSKLNLLSAGLSSQSWIYEVAAPAMDRLSQAIRWPSDLALFEGRGMALRYSTRATAPINVGAAINRADIPMLDSDLGRAFLAFASDEQRCRIMAALARVEPRLDRARPAADQADAVIAQVRSDGYATRGDSFSFARAATIAVAVTVGGQSVAAINVICGRRFVKPSDIPMRYLAPLRQTAAEIGQSLFWDGFVIRGTVAVESELKTSEIKKGESHDGSDRSSLTAGRVSGRASGTKLRARRGA